MMARSGTESSGSRAFGSGVSSVSKRTASRCPCHNWLTRLAVSPQHRSVSGWLVSRIRASTFSGWLTDVVMIVASLLRLQYAGPPVVEPRLANDVRRLHQDRTVAPACPD